MRLQLIVIAISDQFYVNHPSKMINNSWNHHNILPSRPGLLALDNPGRSTLHSGDGYLKCIDIVFHSSLIHGIMLDIDIEPYQFLQLHTATMLSHTHQLIGNSRSGHTHRE